MNRIDAIFAERLSRGEKALMPFVTAGDPDLAATAALLPALERAGASIVELGIPFSDPIADGPVIQASMTHALERGVRVEEVFETVAEQRERVGLGIVAMVSYSIVCRVGIRRFVERAKAAGVDGFIFPDLSLDESDQAVETVRDAGLILSMLISPGTSPQRAERIAGASSGFLYVLSRAGITGERATLPPELPERIQRLRDVTDLPIAVGFGISDPQQVAQVVSVADAAIVGTALVRRISEQRGEGTDAVVQTAETFTRKLAEGLPSTSNEAATS